MSDQVSNQEKYLHEHRAWNWQWPNGNRWDTGQPVVKRHKNAVKCNYTPLPGCAHKRRLRRQRALTGNARRVHTH